MAREGGSPRRTSNSNPNSWNVTGGDERPRGKEGGTKAQPIPSRRQKMLPKPQTNVGRKGGGTSGTVSYGWASESDSLHVGGAWRGRGFGRAFSSASSKRGGALHRGGSRGGDSDSGSLASSSAEDESGSSGGGSGALDPLEHAWMLCASDGRWESLESLLSCEPALLPKRDFITGFTCLHWAAKLGHPELLARLVNFAHRQCLPVNINARTSGGYTALHLAAMHGHLEVVKLLVGAYDADVDVRDYSGHKASHYLSRGTAEEVRSLVGALQDEVDGGASNGSSRWRLSRVLPSHLITYKIKCFGLEVFRLHMFSSFRIQWLMKPKRKTF
uniref:Sosondowah ankyrin repeat domain family member C n=1 Tax=Laticauda laticaudata TaxID=8630 RepID=A0A8C5S5Z9_LATLA